MGKYGRPALVYPQRVPLLPVCRIPCHRSVLHTHTLCSRLSLQLVLAIPSLNQFLAQPPPALPRVPEGCISLIAGLLLAARSATILMVPSSPPAWASAAQSGWLGAAARPPTPGCPVALAILPPACGRQGARPAAGRGLGRRPVASPTPRVHSRRDCGKIAFEIPIRGYTPMEGASCINC